MDKKKIFLIIILLTTVIIAFIFSDELNIEKFKTLIHQMGMWGPLLFMLIYILLTVLVFPVTLLTVASGALFGPVWGTLYSLTAATIGASFAFLLSRYIAADMIKQRAGKTLKRLIDGVNHEGWYFVAFVRLVPLFPFNLVNFAFGLTSIKLLPYVITTYICMLPGAFAYTYLGYVAGSAAMGHTENLIKNILLSIAVLAVIAFIPKLFMRYRKKKA